MELTKPFLDNLEYRVTGACIEVHRELGPGLLESVYQKCLAYEFQKLNISYVKEHLIELTYKGNNLDTMLRADFVVENCIVLEIKTVEHILPIHKAQILSYMKLLRAPKGLMINFNCTNIVNNGKLSFVSEMMYDLDGFI